MQVSAEIRWFWTDSAPAGLEEWFRSREAHQGLGAGGGTTPRTDFYRRDSKQAELAIKLRGNKPGCEVKGLVGRLEPLAGSPFVGTAELWAKWSADGPRLEAEKLIATTKLRWIRKFDTAAGQPREVELGPDEQAVNKSDFPEVGCQVELTQIFVLAERWWSFSFESFGSLATVERDLRAVATLMAARQPPQLPGGLLASYPSWLKDRLAEADPPRAAK